MVKRKRNHQWQRIVSPESQYLDQGAIKRYHRRKAIMDDPIFKESCSKAGVEPTIRQARKWGNKKGLAFTFKN